MQALTPAAVLQIHNLNSLDIETPSREIEIWQERRDSTRHELCCEEPGALVPYKSDRGKLDVKIPDLDREAMLEEKIRQYRDQHAVLHCQMPQPSLGEQHDEDSDSQNIPDGMQSFPGLAFLTLGDGFDPASTSKRRYWHLYDLFHLSPPDAYDG
ncbi:unnamed protein product [Polarella glacialis]|uniref:Uncharacterized protein n=1 Tax=Polarella glacialis TaxID=89957 RepID=A0A813DTZ2_POLGL|nr:unnamed protein product [Polarella glacialis]